jgi:hypothetical protein
VPVEQLVSGKKKGPHCVIGNDWPDAALKHATGACAFTSKKQQMINNKNTWLIIFMYEAKIQYY